MLKLATVCSGIGAPEKALKRLGIDYGLSYWCEYDKYAAKAYEVIHNADPELNLGDLTTVDADKLPDDLDLLVGGTPCQDFSTAGKERGGEGRICLTGVRRAESVKRAGRRPYEIQTARNVNKVIFNDNDEDRRAWEYCAIKWKHVCNPITEWTDEDVWEFIRGNGLPYCKLYDEGWRRIGCIGCPMASLREREKEFARYPWYKRKYIEAFDSMLANMGDKARTWKNGEDVFNWWLYGDTNKLDKGQITFDFEEEQK